MGTIWGKYFHHTRNNHLSLLLLVTMLHWFSLRQRWIDTERIYSPMIFRYSKQRRWPLLNTGWWKLQPCHNLRMPCQKLIFHLTATSCWWLKLACTMLIFTMFIGQVLCQPSGNNRNQNWPQRPDCPGPRCGAPGVPGSGCRARRATAGSAGGTWRACSSPPPPPASRPSSPPSAWRPAPPRPPATWCSAQHVTCYLSMVFGRLITDSLCLSTLDQVSMAIYGRPFRKH